MEDATGGGAGFCLEAQVVHGGRVRNSQDLWIDVLRCLFPWWWVPLGEVFVKEVG